MAFQRASSLPFRGSSVHIFVLSLVVIWIVVINRFRPEWSLNPEYSYGWAAPFLCVYLVHRRINAETQKRRDADERNTKALKGGNAEIQRAEDTSWSENISAFRLFPVSALFFVCLLYFVFRLVHEANPGWGFADWGIALSWVAITLLLVEMAGGRRWVRALAFPICFFLVAVPWPWGVREMIVQALTRLNVAVGVELLGFIGVPALQKGNVVEIATGLVGIEDACSGIRSFQSTLMIGLFFGELYRFSIRRRIELVLGGVALAFALNVVRTVTLVWVAARNGLDAIHKWHDPVGVPILVGCFLGVWMGAQMLRKSEMGNQGNTETAKGDGAQASPNAEKRKSEKAETRSASISAFQHFSVSIFAAVFFLLSEVVVELWYRTHERQAGAAIGWSAAAPVGGSEVKETPIPKGSTEMLGYDSGNAWRWIDESGRFWQMFYFRWQRGRAERDVSLALSHRPEICLPASGFTMESDLGLDRVKVHGLSLPFRTYVFTQSGVPVHVFRCAVQDGSERLDPGHNFSYSGRRERLQAVWEGRRRSGARVLELGVWGCTDAAEAKHALQRTIEKIVKAETQKL